jgi:hypothetical protein
MIASDAPPPIVAAGEAVADAQTPSGSALAARGREPIVWPTWPPRLSLVPCCSNPCPRPPGTLLRYIFAWAYLTLDASTWVLPLRHQSDAVFRAIVLACRSLRSGCQGFDYMTLDPELHGREYLTITALALVDDVEDYLADMNADHPDDEYPVAPLDPDHRRPPSARAGHG